MTFPTGYFYKERYDFYEIMGWTYSDTPAHDLGLWTWQDYATDHPEEAKEHRHKWTHTFELEGTEIVVYLIDEGEQCTSDSGSELSTI